MENEEINNTIYVVMLKDRHYDANATLFLTPEKAIAYAQNILDENSEKARHVSSDDARMTDEELDQAGWLFYGCYSVEGDCVWVYPTKIMW